MYGNGDIGQCFCRLCAVFGGFYFLRFPLAGFTIDPSTNQCTGVVANTGERFRAKDIVIASSSFMESASSNKNVIHRIVLITNKSIKPSEKEEVKGKLKSDNYIMFSFYRLHMFVLVVPMNQAFILLKLVVDLDVHQMEFVSRKNCFNKRIL